MVEIYGDRKSPKDLFFEWLQYGWKLGEAATSTYRALPNPQPFYIDEQQQRRLHHGEAGIWIILGSALIGGIAYSLAEDQQTKDAIAGLTGLGIGFGAQLTWDDKEDQPEWFH